MFPWSKKITKSVTFNSEVADETLLAVVETELIKQPHKTFSDLCKEALWQFLCVPESVRPTPKAAQMEQPGAELKRQFAEFEQRFLARDSSRLEAMERQLNQLSQQLAQLSLIVNQQPKSEPHRQFVQEVQKAEVVTPTPPPEIDDPLLSRLSAFLDDF
jgi:hypothetical protein